jgi:hypothetical protein
MVPVRSEFSPGTKKPCPLPNSVALPDSLVRSAYSEKTVEAFLKMFNPKGVLRIQGTDAGEFVNILPLLSIRDEALQTAVLAVGITQIGTTTGDEVLTRQGRILYGKALKETAVALRNPTRANSESLLVVPRVMALFNLLFGADAETHSQAKSWLSHAEGEMAIVFSRGPEAFSKNDTIHSLFINARLRLLIPAVRGRKATILNNEEWKVLPWKGRTKTSEDVLIDIFCGIPELLEAVDKLSFSSMSEERREGLQVYTVAKCWTLHFQLQTWADTEANEAYTPEVNDATTPIPFPDIDTAATAVRYWLTALFLYSSLDIALGIDPTTDFDLTHADRPHPRPFARMIVRAVGYFFQDHLGIPGVTAIWLPLGNALFHMNRNRAADIKYIMVMMESWRKPNLPSMMADFLTSFRRTVTWGTLIPIPMDEL